MQISVEKLVYGGEGLGRSDGQIVLTPFVLPGEIIETSAAEDHASFQRAKLERVIAASEARIQPGCPFFGRCGGCHYQHANYVAQLEAKRDILVETLRRVGKIAYAGEIRTIAGEPWGYRNRVQLHFRNGQMGYLGMRSHKLCAIDRCPISSPKINTCIAALGRMSRDRRWPGFLQSLEIFTDETAVQLNVLETRQPVAKRFFSWCAQEIPGLIEGPLNYGAYRVSRGSFFQVNRFLIDRLTECALDGEGETALDLYAGVGLFSLPLARRFETVTAVESGRAAADDLRHNAKAARLKIAVETAEADSYLRTVERAPDFVLADPPRAGLGKAVTGRLVELRPERLTILACDPATLARDLAAFLDGGYAIDRLTLIDLFPQTFHIECAASLVRIHLPS